MQQQVKKNTREAGQGLVEYALILVLVAVVVIVVLALLGPAIGNTFSNILCQVERSCTVVAGGSGTGISITHPDFTACSNTCSNSYYTCTQNASLAIAYSPNGLGQGATGTYNGACTAGAAPQWFGNFYHGQTLVVTNNTTSASQTLTVP